MIGKCEWCGGSQSWTVIGGEVYSSCDGGCSPLPGLRLDPPHDSPELRRPERTPKMELLENGGVEPLEGGDARMNDVEDELPW